MFGGKMKALTFSFDDGVTQDIRFIEILNKYNLKATFNLNSELLGNDGFLDIGDKKISHVKVNADEVKKIYEGHEVAVHTLTHPLLPDCSDEEIIRQVEEDRKNLEKLVGYDIVGMAYPCGGVNNNDRVAEIIKKNTKIRYSRTITSSHSFDLQDNLYRFNPTGRYTDEADNLLELGRKFLELKADSPQIFYIWGHTYEFDINDTWAEIEEFCKMMANRDDIFYGTNREVLL